LWVVGLAVPALPSRDFTIAVDDRLYFHVFRAWAGSVVLEFFRQGWITVFAGLHLALITLLTSYAHIELLGGAFVDLLE
jgi:hypothetical protein